jgi:hypothetical protein
MVNDSFGTSFDLNSVYGTVHDEHIRAFTQTHTHNKIAQHVSAEMKSFCDHCRN